MGLMDTGSIEKAIHSIDKIIVTYDEMYLYSYSSIHYDFIW